MNTIQILQNIKTLRKKVGLTQMDMSEKMGLTQQNYGLLENGKTELTISKIQKLAEVFGVSVGELLGIEVVGKAGEATEVEALKRENEELKEKVGLQSKLSKLLEKQIIDITYYAKKVIAKEVFNWEINNALHNTDSFCFIDIFELFYVENPDIFHLFRSLGYEKEKDVYYAIHNFIVEAYENEVHLLADNQIEMSNFIDKNILSLQSYFEYTQPNNHSVFTKDEITKNFEIKIELLKRNLHKLPKE